MQERLKQFWLPSLVTLLLSWGCLAILIWAGVQPYMSRPANDPERLLIYWPWLVMLPFVGALGAYMARRAQSNRWKIYTAGAFPVVATAVVFLLLCPWAYMSGKKFIAVGADMLNWVLLPGIALLIGVAVEGLLSRSTRVGHA